jgi:type VII secretion integral membrane protein EccD
MTELSELSTADAQTNGRTADPLAPVIQLHPNAQPGSSMNATAPTAPATRQAAAGTDLCRLTVSGPKQSADLAIPASATLGELLPILVRHAAGDDADQGPWVLQRLGGPPLDFGATAEALDLREGEVLYLSPESAPLPEIGFDDVSVGVAHSVSTRADRWRPAFSRMLLTAAAGFVAVAFAVGVAGARPSSTRVACYLLAGVVLAVGAVLATRLAADRAGGTALGLGACAFAGLTGFAARHGASGLFTLDRRAVMIAGCAVAAAAILVAVAGRLSPAVFGAVTGTGVAAAVGAGLATAFHAAPVTLAAILATVLFAATTTNSRIALRLAQLRVALLPRTAEELQEDIDPLPESMISGRTQRAVALLDALAVTCSLVYATAFVLLARQPGWAGWVLAGVFSVAVLLRARALNLAWQRAPLALSGVAGLCLVAARLIRDQHPTGRAPGLLLMLVCVAILLAAAAALPGRRLLPVWGQLADLAELWSAIALIPLLLQMLHVYAHFRALVK